MRAVAFIPARSGSKRFPGKHRAQLDGLSLLELAQRIALEAQALGVVDHVVVSCDVHPGVVLRGVEFRDRIEQLAGDDVRLVDVLLAYLYGTDRGSYGRHHEPPDALCLLLPTSPLRTLRHVVESRLLLHEPGVNIVLSVVPCAHPPQWALAARDGWLTLAWPTADWQTTKPTAFFYHDGTVAWIWARHLRETRELYGPGLRAYPIRPEDSWDVNTPLDLEIAEVLWRRRERLSTPIHSAPAGRE